MLRVRVAVVTICLLLDLAVIFYPVEFAYTEWLGDRAVATVTGCHFTGKSQECRSTWVGRDGRRHSGTLQGTSRSDVGKQVRIRVGLFGPSKDNAASRIISLAMLVGFGLVAQVVGIIVARRSSRRRRAAGDKLLSTPVPYGATRLFANGKRIWRPDGAEVAALRPAPAPPGFQPVSPPGRMPHQRSGSVLEAVRWLAYNPAKGARFVGARQPDGVPMFLLHRAPAGSYTPETALLDPGGATRAVIRRTRDLPGRYALLTPDGHQLGSIEQTDRTLPDYAVRDEHGQQVGRLTAQRNRWIVELQDGTPLRDPALAFAADAYRLRL